MRMLDALRRIRLMVWDEPFWSLEDVAEAPRRARGPSELTSRNSTSDLPPWRTARRLPSPAFPRPG